MNENELRELFKATNTAEPLCEGWPGLLRFGLAVAAAEREACAKMLDAEASRLDALGVYIEDVAHLKKMAAAMRSNGRGNGLAATGPVKE